MFIIIGIIAANVLNMPVLIIFIILIAVLISFLSSEKRTKDGIALNGIKKQDLRDYINNLPENERNDAKYSEVLAAISEQPSESVQSSEPHTFEQAPPSPNRDYGSVEVSVQSTENGASFTFNVDGRVIGYIGPQRSVLTVPSGMHQVTVATADMNKKEIYSENILFNTKKSFTVRKKFGRYVVTKD